MVLALSIFIALIAPILFLFALRAFDLHKTVKFGRNILTLAAGLCAYLLAVVINRSAAQSGWLTWDQIVWTLAPFAEELLKSLVLVYLVSRADFNYVVDGALYGFGAGIGFAVIENVEYIQGARIEYALALAVMRVFSTNLVHATGSGAIGAALAFYRGGPDKRRGWLAIAGSYPFAMVLHGFFNFMVSTQRMYLVVAIVYGALGAALIWWFIRRGMAAQKKWVGETLGDADRVTKEETRAVLGMEKMVETLIVPFRNRFGDEKVPLVKELLYAQAEIGIKRKLLDATPSPTKRKELEGIVLKLSGEMNKLRGQIGMYPMMFVREVYLEQDIRLWDRLQARIAESGPGQKGGGVWDLATSRIRKSKAGEENP